MKELDLSGAAAAVRQGELLIYPTETFFALGCSALDAKAVRRIFDVKHRPYHYPLPIIIGNIGQLGLVAKRVSPLARQLIEKFWPGPLSILLPASKAVPWELCAGTGCVAVRLSSHAGAYGLSLAADRPLVSSSANISGRPPAADPADLDPELTAGVDGGFYNVHPHPAGGLPSSIVEVSGQLGSSALRVLREGAISASVLRGQGFTVLETEPENKKISGGNAG